MFEKYLQEIGLSDKEASVYIALLSVDNDSVLDLASKTKINRTTIYPILESLAQKGLISEVKLDKKVRFQAEPPERLSTFVEKQKLLFEERSERIKDIIPRLKAIQRESGEKPVVKIYDGKEGALSAVEEIFNSMPEDGISYSIYSKDLLDEMFSEKEREKFFKLRKDIKKLKSKSIYVRSLGDMPDNEISQRVRLDGKKYPISCDINIIGDETRISNLKTNPTTIFIKNKDLAETLKSIINFIHDKK
jgi:sugar-specific transcriptional regulator TrmB